MFDKNDRFLFFGTAEHGYVCSLIHLEKYCYMSHLNYHKRRQYFLFKPNNYVN